MEVFVATNPASSGSSPRPQAAFRRCVHWPGCLAAGGILLQTASTGCGQNLSNLAGALGNPIATGVGAGLARLVEALTLNLFI